jgi:multicomponent Na+:H+ antiporter subunit B
MIWQLDFIILALLVPCALAAISLKDMLSAAVTFGTYSFLMCLLWTEMGAVDVAFTEAAVGAGVSTVLFIAAIYRSRREVVSRRLGRYLFKAMGLLCAGVIGAILLWAESDFPSWAAPDIPPSEHVSPYYITHTLEDTSVPNIVTSVLADYRGFDTMFETAVIFAAGMAVIAILRRGRRQAREPEENGPAHQSLIIQTVSRMLVPFMQLFALYVVAHGHHSPGGGFQGGVILGASFILLALSYDLDRMLKRLGERWNLLWANLGVVIYAGIGSLAVLLGANFLDYSALSRILPATGPIEARSHGMLGVEIGVAITVMAIMVAIYANIASHGKYDRGL